MNVKVTFDPVIDEQNAVAKTSWMVWVKRALIALVIAAILAGLWIGIKKLMSGGAPQKRQITTVKLIPDTPPPPPPPPPKEPPKEQPKEQPKEAPKAPEPKPAETPPAETLKMEGQAGDGPSPFQSGPVTNEYSGGQVSTIGSDGGAKFNWYANLMKSRIENAIERESALTQGQYKLIVSIWVKENGDVEKIELLQSDASPEIEQIARETLKRITSIDEAPPQGMPQPVKLRITAKKMG